MNCVVISRRPVGRDEARCTTYTDLDTWLNWPKLLERAASRLILADVVGVYDVLEESSSSTYTGGAVPVNDSRVTDSGDAYATNISVSPSPVDSASTIPLFFARLISTLDHLTKGRVAWNIVTSLPGEWRA